MQGMSRCQGREETIQERRQLQTSSQNVPNAASCYSTHAGGSLLLQRYVRDCSPIDVGTVAVLTGGRAALTRIRCLSRSTCSSNVGGDGSDGVVTRAALLPSSALRLCARLLLQQRQAVDPHP